MKIRGVEVDRGEIIPDSYMAMNPGTATEELDGIQTREPAFGLPAGGSVPLGGRRRR